MNCIFCNIITGEQPAAIVYRDENATAFRDINPKAPVHILIVPNRHVVSVNELEPDDEALIGRLFSVARNLAAQEDIAASGYRIVVNTGPDAGQSVFHFHIHLLGKRRMHWPPG